MQMFSHYSHCFFKIFFLFVFLRCVGAGHVIHPVHSVRSARDPCEAVEEPEHSSQQ